MEMNGELMQFDGTHIVGFNVTPADDGITSVLILTAKLTPDIAEMMGCRASIFDQHGQLHQRITRADLGESKLRDIDVILPAVGTTSSAEAYRPELVHKFVFNRIENENEGDGMSVTMRCRFKNRENDLLRLVRKMRKKPFEFAIRSHQQAFDWAGAIGGTQSAATTEGEEAEGTEEVPPLLVIAAATCRYCSAGDSKNDEGKHMADGKLVECEIDHPPAAEAPAETINVHGRKRGNVLAMPEGDSGGPAIADARDVAGKKPRPQRTRGEMAPPPDAARAADSVSVQ